MSSNDVTSMSLDEIIKKQRADSKNAKKTGAGNRKQVNGAPRKTNVKSGKPFQRQLRPRNNVANKSLVVAKRLVEKAKQLNRIARSIAVRTKVTTVGNRRGRLGISARGRRGFVRTRGTPQPQFVRRQRIQAPVSAGGSGVKARLGGPRQLQRGRGGGGVSSNVQQRLGWRQRRQDLVNQRRGLSIQNQRVTVGAMQSDLVLRQQRQSLNQSRRQQQQQRQAQFANRGFRGGGGRARGGGLGNASISYGSAPQNMFSRPLSNIVISRQQQSAAQAGGGGYASKVFRTVFSGHSTGRTLNDRFAQSQPHVVLSGGQTSFGNRRRRR